jgi:hypothetical protein
VDLLHHVDAVDDELLVAGHAQRHVEHGPLLGHVDLLAGEHGVDPLAQAGGLGDADEEADRLRRQPVLRVVEEEALGLDREAFAPLRVGGEEVAQVRVPYVPEVRHERLPLGGVGDRRHARPNGRGGRVADRTGVPAGGRVRAV